MSYVRWGPKSDLYMFESDRGLECCGCALDLSPFGSTVVFTDTKAAVQHVQEHIDASHKVPNGLLEDVQNRTELRFIVWATAQRGPDGMSLSADTIAWLIRDGDDSL